MSQSRARKAPSGSDAQKQRPSVVKAAGDNNTPCPQPKETRRSNSRHKLPKSIRYDLENALVGLCDVWFDEIKPHLIRNNIKLHVEGSGASTKPGGDHCPAPALPHTLARDCSHLDPGAASDRLVREDANFAGSCTTPRTALRAPSPRPPPLAPRPPPDPRPPPPVPCSPLTLRHLMCQSNMDGIRKPRNLCQQHPKINPTCPVRKNWRVLRYSRSNLQINYNRKVANRSSTTQKSSIKFIRPSQKKEKTADKTTQTDLLSNQIITINPGVKIHEPETKYSKGITDITSAVSLASMIRVRKHRPAVPQKRHLSPQLKYGTQKPQLNLDKRTIRPPVDNRPASPAPAHRAPLIARPVASRNEPITDFSPRRLASPRCRTKVNTRPNSPSIETTAFYPARIAAKHSIQSPKRKQNSRDTHPESLFDKDLINIIGEHNDKRLQMYVNPTKGGDSMCGSIMKLCPSPRGRRAALEAARCAKTIIPWR